jgi:hypothetical protein
MCTQSDTAKKYTGRNRISKREQSDNIGIFRSIFMLMEREYEYEVEHESEHENEYENSIGGRLTSKIFGKFKRLLS